MSRLVVADTGPSIHLAQAGELRLLELVGDLRIPQAVLDELGHGSTDISELEFVVEQVEYDESTYPHLDPGETAALVLCSERDASMLTDDLDARTTAQDEDIEVHGSAGVALYAYSHGELSEEAAKRVLRTLERDTNPYLSTPLIEHAIKLVESDEAGCPGRFCAPRARGRA